MILGLVFNVAWAEVDASIVDADQQWWRSWEDPKLVELIEEGLQEAPDIEIALSRVAQAEQISKQLRAGGFLPSVSVSTNINMQPADALGFGFGLSSLDDLFPTDPNIPLKKMTLQIFLPHRRWLCKWVCHWTFGDDNTPTIEAAVIDAEASNSNASTEYGCLRQASPMLITTYCLFNNSRVL